MFVSTSTSTLTLYSWWCWEWVWTHSLHLHHDWLNAKLDTNVDVDANCEQTLSVSSLPFTHNYSIYDPRKNVDSTGIYTFFNLPVNVAIIFHLPTQVFFGCDEVYGAVSDRRHQTLFLPVLRQIRRRRRHHQWHDPFTVSLTIYSTRWSTPLFIDLEK